MCARSENTSQSHSFEEDMFESLDSHTTVLI